MNYYFLPGAGTFGGVKMAYQFAACLNELGVPCIAATPDGTAPGWFTSSVATIESRQALKSLSSGDTAIFSLPHDYGWIRQLDARPVFHCVGTDPMIHACIGDPRLTILTAWPQAADYVMQKTGRRTVDVHAAISPVFFYDGSTRMEGSVAYMPRRGSEIARACIAELPHLEFRAIEKMPERDVAAFFKSSEFYLATSVGEWFGLPALEAMAAGCVVVSVPVLGGMDYLRNDANSLVASPAGISETLREAALPENHGYRSRLRDNALATAYAFTMARHRQRLSEQLDGPLRFLRV